jgi:hypothetical protein
MVPSADFIDLAFRAQGLAVSLVETVMISELENPPREVENPFVVIASPLFASRVERGLLVSVHVAAENAIHAMDPNQPRTTDIYHGKTALFSNHAYDSCVTVLYVLFLLARINRYKSNLRNAISRIFPDSSQIELAQGRHRLAGSNTPAHGLPSTGSPIWNSQPVRKSSGLAC